MKLSNFLAGVEILRKHAKSEHILHGSHERISVVISVDPESVAEKAQLEDLGWFIDNDIGGHWTANASC